MGDQSHCHVSFWSQVNALLMKNLTFQGSEFSPGYTNFEDPAFTLDPFTYSLQRRCPPDFNFSVFVWNASDELRQGVDSFFRGFCVEGLPLWHNSSSEINGELYKGYVNGNSEGKTNEIFAAYGFSNSNEENFNVSIWYNSTYISWCGVPYKQAKTYSGGMKRRLSVAISLIGDPKVVYMDEPSTGLDPASRKNLWNVKCALQDWAIILATRSMQEAEVLCDRVGIFVDGSLQCLGNPKELIARYGGSYVFTITTSSIHEEDVEKLVRTLSPSVNKIYHVSGTQKFELPKTEIRIADIFKTVEIVKSRFTIYASNLADATLEEVFIKVACGAQEANA